MPYRLYAATGPGWSAAPVEFESAEKALGSALKMMNRERMVALPYRFYEMATSGFRSPAQDSACSSDIDAMMHAGSLIKGDGSVEIWRGSRFVGEIGQRFSRWAPAHPLWDRPSEKSDSLNQA